MRWTAFGLLLLWMSSAAATGCRFSPSRAASGLDVMTEPRYDEAGALIRPEGYRKWVFVGATLGLRYAEDGEPEGEGPGTFHNVYIQPEAFDHFMEHGVFAEKTMLAMETYETGTRDPRSGLTDGYFEDALAGFSVAVKDSERFDESWGYVSFAAGDTATPFPRTRCYDCHLEHGAVDNVFTQFYPILRR